jgi:uncharacterized repeat protein (TIGR01451 family)
MCYRFVFFIVALLIAQVTIAQLFGEQQIISTNADGAMSVHTADLDGDGDMDVLSASRHDDKIAWYENLGGGLFGDQHIISTEANNAWTVHSSDLDGDGDMDVLSASAGDNKIAWYENLGGGLFSDQQIISTQAEWARTVQAADLDGDGDMDVLSASQNDDKIAWYENLGGGLFGVQQIISTEADDAESVHTADLDGDGDMDVLSASITDDKIAWYENLGGGLFGDQQVISVQADFAYSVNANDLDGDGDMDVLSASGFDDKIAWYENLGGGLFGAQQIISEQVEGANFVHTADLDADGDMDVLSDSPYNNYIVWFENLGEGLFGIQQIISPEVNWAYSIHSADLDGDGDLDVLSASSEDDKIAWYENLSGEGCIDPGACNYDADAWLENGSCCYVSCGCTNPIAVNYLESATCDNGTCEFIINGTVFFDENENGIMDGDEYGLPFQTVMLEVLNITYMTNDEGNFTASIGQAQLVEFSLQENPAFPFHTTPNLVLFNVETAESALILFGVSNEEPDFAVELYLYPAGNGFLCNDYSNHNLSFRNMGNVPIHGVIELEYDELFQGHQEITPIDSVVGNIVYMSFENLLPGQMFFYNIDLLTPTVDHVGEFVTSFARIYGYNEGEQVAYGEKELTMEITCAYDPNDKQALPLGYTDEHWLLQETEQEFLIRFQNTGNAPAQDVRIQDTIDLNFDLSTIRFIANSHSVMTTINEETRVIDFFFEGIQLPDSVNNEPESHGLVSYAITPYAGLDIGTELNNTAHIYFDNNDAIVTNTTWTTIHECGGEAAFVVSSTEICAGETIDFTSTYEQVESHQWNINSTPESTENNFSKTFDEAGEYNVQLEAENPLCNTSSVQTITVFPIPTVAFTQEGDLLTASEGVAYQWYLNGEEIEGATEQNYVITVDGTYYVEVTNEYNCTAASEGIMIVGVSELDSNTILLYPNPMTDRAYLEFEVAATRTVRLVDSTGKEVRVYQSVNAERLEITKADLAPGNYSVTVQENTGIVYSFQIVVK